MGTEDRTHLARIAPVACQSGEVSHNIVTWNSGQTTNRMTMIRMGNGGRNKDKGAKSCDWAGQEGKTCLQVGNYLCNCRESRVEQRGVSQLCSSASKSCIRIASEGS